MNFTLLTNWIKEILNNKNTYILILIKKELKMIKKWEWFFTNENQRLIGIIINGKIKI